MPGEKLVLTVAETTDLLSVGETLVYQLIRQGTIPSLRVGRLIRVPRERLLDRVSSAVGGRVALAPRCAERR